MLKPSGDSKENILGGSGPNPLQNQAEAPLLISEEEELSHIDEDSQSNCSDLKTPTQGANNQYYVTPGSSVTGSNARKAPNGQALYQSFGPQQRELQYNK